MNKYLGALILAGLAGLLWIKDASAQPSRFITREAGPYFRFDIGPNFAQDGEIEEFTGAPAGGRVEYAVGFTMDAAIGYAFNSWLATEFEFGWSYNEIDSVTGFALDDTFFYHLPFLANLVLQYPIPRTRLVPYIGGGVGGAAAIFDTDGFTDGAVVLVGSDDDFVFAYQGFAGLRFNLNDQMYLGLHYKYFAAEDTSFSYEVPFPFVGPSQKVGFDGTAIHGVTFSFTIKF